MEVTRVYKNTSDETLRVDTILMHSKYNNWQKPDAQITYQRSVTTSLVAESTDRVIASVEIVTDADVIDFNPSTTNDYTYVEWTKRNRTIRCNMSDLPGVGDTV